MNRLTRCLVLGVLLGLAQPRLASAQSHRRPPPRAAPPPAACSYTADMLITSLIRGSHTDLLFNASGPRCLDSMKSGAWAPALLHNVSNKDVTLSMQAQQTTDGRLALDLSTPANLPAVGPLWSIEVSAPGGENKTIGTTQLAVEQIANPKQLEVSYARPLLNHLQSGRSAPNADGLPVAVVNPAVRRALGGVGGAAPVVTQQQIEEVVNIAAVTFPSSVSLDSGTWYQWRLRGTNWGDDVWFRCAKTFTAGGSQPALEWLSGGCWLRDAQRLPFVVGKGRTTPLTATIELLQIPAGAAADASLATFVNITTVTLTLAGEAREESVPAPIGNALITECEGDYNPKALNGNVVAFDEDALREGKCKLVFSPLPSDIPAVLFGEQIVEVSLSREGVAPGTPALWSIDLESAGKQEFRLSAPQGAENGSGLYRIDVKVAASSPQANYRAGSLQHDYSGKEIQRPEFSYVTRLRPRGLFALSVNYRVFVTIPLNLTGLRLPATSRDLQSSTDNPSIQALPLHAGVLLGLEPWNYNEGKNRYALPMRALAGFNLVDLKHTSFIPSFLVGASMTAPLIESSSQFGTSVALGLFYELDMRSKSSHVLVTLGLNLFSLLGAK